MELSDEQVISLDNNDDDSLKKPNDGYRKRTIWILVILSVTFLIWIKPSSCLFSYIGCFDLEDCCSLDADHRNHRMCNITKPTLE